LSESEMKNSQQDPRYRNELAQSTNLADYAAEYARRLQSAFSAVEPEALQKAFDALAHAARTGAHIYVAGNGGSAAIADHLCCDWMKGTAVPTMPAVKVHSLVCNTALLTALTNDFGYEDALARQIGMLGEEGDLLVLISSSGNSSNIERAAVAASKKKMKIIGLCGFSGGKLKKLSDICLYTPANNYGIVEDAHQMLMHVLAQALAQLRDSQYAQDP
jgi:D-sedoheptulose 7-phosphate isomerase